MRRGLLAVIAASFVWPAYAMAKEEYTDCSVDADCVVIQGLCAPIAVNAAYRHNAEDYFKAHAKNATCVKEFWKPNPDQVEARCRLERCETVGK